MEVKFKEVYVPERNVDFVVVFSFFHLFSIIFFHIIIDIFRANSISQNAIS